ncbi:RbsD/FucU family protein [Saccharothrix hoggarensis]|uniref:RbsD/FucU family protein n=1 Tax=Saccharothrix hoggarensis TaxID=913853 RepID=A0ABW3R1L5_9PSEU
MLRYPLLHPPLLSALATAGHGSKVLLADSNYAHRTNVHHRATLIHLNLRPGLVSIDDVLEPVLSAIPVEAVHTMRPDDLSTPAAWADYERLLGPDLPLQPLARHDFYATCRESDLAVCVATGDGRHYANLLLTVGAVAP